MPGCKLDLIKDAAASATAAQLRYVGDDMPGIRRRATRGGFKYIGTDGREVTDPDERLRIKSLAVPPAWTDVWICPDPRGHLQATGRDARGRKQYRYHKRWREVRDEAKYHRLLSFGQRLPQLRRRIARDLGRGGLPKRKVVGALLALLESTLIRIGNDEYALGNQSYGLTTLNDRHAQVNGSEVRFRFRGKSGKEHSVGLRDRRLARIVKHCRDIPGQRLFQYLGDDGQFHAVHSEDVNDYLHEAAGDDFTAKDFRTWAGTLLTLDVLEGLGAPASEKEAKRKVAEAIKAVAERLGNTPAVCRGCYVHPAVTEAYMQGELSVSPASRVAGGARVRALETQLLHLLAADARVRATPAKPGRRSGRRV